ncbi:MAG: CDP-alcohol phosphatidyltransferase family protein [Actinobacteria bacterium]|nr:CDP-alcohol phosphatidyltransferase family protein [Actinomycetota bacterium]
MIHPRLQALARRVVEWLVAPLGATRLDPNALTVAGLAVSFATAFVIALGWTVAGGVLVLVAGAFDMLDGALARVRRAHSTFGAFLDSTLDRWAEGLIFTGLLWHLEGVDHHVEALLAVLTLIGSMLISYARARAEGLGIACTVGFFQRPERLIVLGIALLGPPWLLTGALWFLAVVTQLTAIQRIVHVHQQIEAARSREPG